jgi:hypothetical protein
MNLKATIGAVLVIIVIILLVIYFMPFNELEFTSTPLNYNFTFDGNISNIQFYPNMRFENKDLSYKIEDCNIRKQEEMRNAFDIVENLTILSFSPVSSNEDITVTCDERARYEGGMFIAGEGGPTKIVRAGKYSVILHGKILLLRSSDCEKPNVALHELFHVLGFVHSNNPNNVMYNYTKCKQTIGNDIPKLINEVYSVPNYPDLVFESASGSMSGRYLNLNMTVRNLGLKDSKSAVIKIKMQEDILKEVELEPLEIGNGRVINLNNLFVGKISIKGIDLIIDYSEKELDKTNNNLILEISE